MFIALRHTALSVDEAIAHVSHAGAGGLSLFVGAVRDESAGRAVSALEYHAYESMARAEMERIAAGVERDFPGVRVAALHRLGRLAVGDAAVVCAAGAPHRGEAFAACRALIDRIKADVPIWKREWGPEGPYWVGWVDARCDGGDGHGHRAAGGEGQGHDDAAGAVRGRHSAGGEGAGGDAAAVERGRHASRAHGPAGHAGGHGAG